VGADAGDLAVVFVDAHLGVDALHVVHDDGDVGAALRRSSRHSHPHRGAHDGLFVEDPLA
jgi:hypothetical protein